MIHVIKRDGNEIARVEGNANAPTGWFNRNVLAYSMDHAIKYEGYSVETLSEEGESDDVVRCTYDSGAATDCVPLCDQPATHTVRYRNGSYPLDRPFFAAPMCRRHVSPMEGRVYPGLVETVEICDV